MTATARLYAAPGATRARIAQRQALDQPTLGRVTGNGLALRIDNVGKNFDGREVLRGVSLDIAPGEFVAIVGHSGCGKSTLLRLIAGLDAPTDGRITLEGAADAAAAAAATRLLFQDARLLPWKRVLDNVGIGQKGQWRERALEALHHVGLESRAQEWPSVLSGGQRQRVALARALVSRPRLMLLDEPLGALDALTRLEMQSLVEDVWREEGFTAILVTHDVSEAVALADRVIVLEKGEVGAVWTVDAPRPRERGDARLAQIEADILARLMRRG
jgi:sulfonate transport system ATP-binding protein